MAISKLNLKFLLAVTLVASACNSESTVARHYHEAISAKSDLTTSPQTTIVFLVDGFSVPILIDALNSKRAPNIVNFFSRDGGNLAPFKGSIKLNDPPFRIGRASFPTLTYPNLVSILTGSPVTAHGITGNRVLIENDKIVNFEDVTSWGHLNRMVHDKTIFAHLSSEHLTSVSYSYPFPADSTAHQEESVSAGVDYGSKAYDVVDEATLASLHTLLETTPSAYWPHFIFIHLIGVDAFAHEFGPYSERVQSYVQQLDQNIGDVLRLLQATDEAGRKTTVVMTADHGFSNTNHVIPIEAVLAKVSPDTKVIADNRIASLRFPESFSPNNRLVIAEELVKLKHVRWTILNKGDHLLLYNANGRRSRIDMLARQCRAGSFAARYSRIHEKSTAVSTPDPSEYFCPEEYDADAGFSNDNYIVSSLVEYFTTPGAPDLIAVPDMDADFIGGYKGNHGGLSKVESFVPVLTYRAHLPDGVQETYELLRQLELFK